MKTNIFTMRSIVFLAITFSPLSHAITIDYEGVVSADIDGLAGYIEKGYKSASFEHLHKTVGQDGSIGVQQAADTSGALFQAVDGSNFDLQTMYINSVGTQTGPTTFAGSNFFIDGIDDSGTVQATIELTPGTQFTTLDFAADSQDWTGLDMLHFHFASNNGFGGDISTNSGDDVKWDNIVLSPSAVPVPPAAILFFSALSGLGFMRKKQASIA